MLMLWVVPLVVLAVAAAIVVGLVLLDHRTAREGLDDA